MKQRTVVVGAALALIALFVSIGVASGTPGSGAATVYPAHGGGQAANGFSTLTPS